MGKYIKVFDNHSEYSAFTGTSEFLLPNVSLCIQENDVHYNPYVPMIDGHEYVDLGLPSGTLWATMNIGANSVTDYGNYYQYGKGSAQYTATSGQSDYAGTENPLNSSVDTAAQVWGGSWHMPTHEQQVELSANTYYSWVTINGVVGGKFTSKTDSSKYVFFPTAGYYDNGNQYSVGDFGSYWSATPNGNRYAKYLFLNSNGASPYDNDRHEGYSIRGVVG